MIFAEMVAKDNASLLEYVGSVAFLSNRDGVGVHIIALFRDISQHVDLQSGFSVSERQASAIFSFSSLSALSYPYIRDGIHTITGDLFTISINGEKREYEVVESRPDLSVGNFTVVLAAVGTRKGVFESGRQI